jgi:glycosyltransferase involved in cell wall biosynthesis
LLLEFPRWSRSLLPDSTRTLLFVCNAFDDATRLERAVVTDSPAASRKVVMLSKALREQGVNALILSYGRGRHDDSGRYFRSKIRRVQGVPIIYLPFVHRPILSELLSLFSAIPVIWRLRRVKGRKTILFYNRLALYLPALAIARLLRFETALDLEDGELVRHTLSRVFDLLCSGGALLACRALEGATTLRPVELCYGVADLIPLEPNWLVRPLTVLLGGTVSRDTGADRLADAIRALRDGNHPWASALQFEITGKGDCIPQFEQLAKSEKIPRVVVHGRTTDEGYSGILGRTHVGLALKPNAGSLADTTFPSKVIELASNGTLVVTTDISDVRSVLGDGAVYLTDDGTASLIDRLRWIVENPAQAGAVASRGAQAVMGLCAPRAVSRRLTSLLFPRTA